MGVKITLKRTVRPKNPKRTIYKKLVYKNDAEGFVTIGSSKIVIPYKVNTDNVSTS